MSGMLTHGHDFVLGNFVLHNTRMQGSNENI